MSNVLNSAQNPMSRMSNPLTQFKPPVKDAGGEADQARQASANRAESAQAQASARMKSDVSAQQARADAYNGVGQSVSKLA